MSIGVRLFFAKISMFGFLEGHEGYGGVLVRMAESWSVACLSAGLPPGEVCWNPPRGTGRREPPCSRPAHRRRPRSSRMAPRPRPWR